MTSVRLFERAEFERVLAATAASDAGLHLMADMCRLNLLGAIKLAGSGHPGTSLSAIDILVLLYVRIMNVRYQGWESPHRDVFLSSKGHDAPAVYSVLHALGVLSWEQFIRLRRIGGTPGHPDVSVAGIEANTGSLGMGISKGKGIALAKRLQGHGGRVYVMTGDGELQEGQIWESLSSARHMGLGGLTVIVDHNKVQSDRLVSDTSHLGDLADRFAAFGWNVARCDGHDIAALSAALDALRSDLRPAVLIADTIKGRGVSFMEHPFALERGGGAYPWHAGAPADEPFAAAQAELATHVAARCAALHLPPPREARLEADPPPVALTPELLSDAYGDELVALGTEFPTLVVLDADLAADCRLTRFRDRFPERFVELGIAEQDMVSVAGGLALHGMLPVVNSFAAFLAARANEQIYTNATEQTKIIYVCHYAGLLPASAGHSHQSVRDISLLASLPGVRILQPCNAAETRMALRYCVGEATTTCVLRLPIGPSPRRIDLPQGYALRPGQGRVLRDGRDIAMIAGGPVMLHQALEAADALAETGIDVQVVNMPWINHADMQWLEATLGDGRAVVCIDDHSPVGGLGHHLLASANQSGSLRHRRFLLLGVDGIPACGTAPEVLAAHGLDAASIAHRVRTWLRDP